MDISLIFSIFAKSNLILQINEEVRIKTLRRILGRGSKASRRENKSLKASKEATKAKLTAARAELKKKDVTKKTLTKEQKELISKLSELFPDIDTRFW